MEDYKKAVAIMKTNNMPVKVTLDNRGDIDVIVGFNAPDPLCNEVLDLLERVNVDAMVCGDMSMHHVVEYTNVAGGPRNY